MRRLPLLLAVLLASTPLRAETLKLTTWNLEWLTQRSQGLPEDAAPKTDAAIATLRAYAARVDAGVVAFQEVDGPAMAARVFPPDRYQVLTTGDPVVQQVGLAVRRGIGVVRHADLAALDVYPPTARYPLRTGLDVTLELPGAPLRVLAVHLKTGCWEDALDSRRRACRTLDEQLPVLQGWIAARRAEGVPFAVLGDFNRRMSLPGDGFFAGLQRAAPLVLTTEGRRSPCWGGEDFIDHILLGGPARAWLVPGSLAVRTFGDRDPAEKETLDDHCPVSVSLGRAVTPRAPRLRLRPDTNREPQR